MVATSACGNPGTALYIANFSDNPSFVKFFGSPPADFSPPCSPPPSVPPTIAQQFATSVGTTNATVRAEINPHFWADATYYIQYAAAACIEAQGWGGECVSEDPTSPGQLLSNHVSANAILTKPLVLGTATPLQPGTDYRYRFVSQSSGGGPAIGAEESFHTYPPPPAAKLDCPNSVLRTGASAHLPDCRAYELVSPVDKNGGAVGSPSDGALAQGALDGTALVFGSSTAFAQPVGANDNQYLSQRTAGGWSTASITAPRRTPSLVFGSELWSHYRLFSEDLCSGWLVQDTEVPLAEGAPEGVPNLYRRAGLRPGCGPAGYQLLTSVPPSGVKTGFQVEAHQYVPWAQSFSADGALSAFIANAPLTPDASAAQDVGKGTGIYQLYAAAGEGLHLVSILPNGKATDTASALGTHDKSGVSFIYNHREDSVHHAVSAAGDRLYWTDTGTATEPFGDGRLYVRVNPTAAQSALTKAGRCTEAAKACTYRVSAEGEALSGTSSSSRFLEAAADGSVAYFSSGASLFEFDLDKALANEAAVSQIAAKFKGILGAGDDGSRLYFVSEKSLGGGGAEGEPNLYLYERGAGTRFIATLAGQHDDSFLESWTSPISAFPSGRLSRVAADGSAAAFVSADPALAAQTAGYDSTDPASGRAVREVYRYDAEANGAAGRLACVSCQPAGAAPSPRLTEQPNGNSDSWIYSAATLPPWATAGHPGGVLSADGGRLYFESFEALTLADTNGLTDVYQWEAAGSKEECLGEQGGELYVAASGGCLSLISSGTGSDDAELLDASASGGDVFFLTEASLLPQDPGLADAYDARVGGGFAQPVAQAECEGEACQSPPAPPSDPTPASSSFRGAGNVREVPVRKPCPKGKRRIKRKGRVVCVKKHQAKKHRRAKHDRRTSR